MYLRFILMKEMNKTVYKFILWVNGFKINKMN